ncbi:hypothetical protein AAG906_009930 [Vitis piasezkii]
MQGSKEYKKQRLQLRGCRALCCSCRLSVSSSEELRARTQNGLRQYQAWHMPWARHEQRKKARVGGTKFIVMMAMEKSSYDPREDFRESMVEMIMANRIEEPKDLRGLLNCYVSMNSDEYRGLYLKFSRGLFRVHLQVPQIEKYRSEFVIAKMVIGRNAIEYITIFVHLSLLCIIRTIVAANAATIIAT